MKQIFPRHIIIGQLFFISFHGACANICPCNFVGWLADCCFLPTDCRGAAFLDITKLSERQECNKLPPKARFWFAKLWDYIKIISAHYTHPLFDDCFQNDEILGVMQATFPALGSSAFICRNCREIELACGNSYNHISLNIY